MKKINGKLLDICQKVGACLQAPTQKQGQMLLFVLGLGLISLGTYSQAFAQPAYNDERLVDAFARVLTYLEGAFGALVMVAAGMGAILSSAFGQYKAALGCLVIAVGTFILRSFISTFFVIDVDIAGAV
jgi:hypothetical protein